MKNRTIPHAPGEWKCKLKRINRGGSGLLEREIN